MVQHETSIDTTWAEGELVVRTGESLRFEGTVTGVNLTGEGSIGLVFHADDRGVYRYAKGQLDEVVAQDIQALIVKHVEQALIDSGFTIDPVVASEDYEP